MQHVEKDNPCRLIRKDCWWSEWSEWFTWFEVDAALGRELEGHVAVHAGYGRPVDEHTEAGLTEGSDGIAAGLARWDRAERGHSRPARYQLDQRPEERACASAASCWLHQGPCDCYNQDQQQWSCFSGIHV